MQTDGGGANGRTRSHAVLLPLLAAGEVARVHRRTCIIDQRRSPAQIAGASRSTAAARRVTTGPARRRSSRENGSAIFRQEWCGIVASLSLGRDDVAASSRVARFEVQSSCHWGCWRRTTIRRCRTRRGSHPGATDAAPLPGDGSAAGDPEEGKPRWPRQRRAGSEDVSGDARGRRRHFDSARGSGCAGGPDNPVTCIISAITG
jgi:hypothetical protein